MTKGNINVSVENIFPLIKKFLYSDHEIFLRELISNATDATMKLKHLTNIGEAKVEYGNPKIEVKIDKKGKKLHIIDQGIGMTADEVEKYINQVTFSGAEEFLDKYKDSAKDAGIIGHFGLGFYSAFMVAEKVDVISLKAGKKEAWMWSSDGETGFEITKGVKKENGTSIKLYLNEEGKEYASRWKLEGLVKKYSDHIDAPIMLTYEDTEYDDKGKEKSKQVCVQNRNIIDLFFRVYKYN